MGWINRLSGEMRSYDDEGNRTTVSKDGVSVDRDPHHSESDLKAYRSGEISDVEYRRRYNDRYYG